MKNIFIQKIIKGKELNNKPSLYLVTMNKGIKLEEAKIIGKKELLEWLTENIQ